MVRRFPYFIIFLSFILGSIEGRLTLLGANTLEHAKVVIQGRQVVEHHQRTQAAFIRVSHAVDNSPYSAVYQGHCAPVNIQWTCVLHQWNAGYMCSAWRYG